LGLEATGMKTTFEYNGVPKLRLVAENSVEKLILSEMAEASEKGATTILAMPKAESDEFILEVGKP
jgi:hypothetical protein